MQGFVLFALCGELRFWALVSCWGLNQELFKADPSRPSRLDDQPPCPTLVQQGGYHRANHAAKFKQKKAGMFFVFFLGGGGGRGERGKGEGLQYVAMAMLRQRGLAKRSFAHRLLSTLNLEPVTQQISP